jgi:uncharacterized 2Fe-2S/4Fe-4S cluster protein (DUF4445 family)
MKQDRQEWREVTVEKGESLHDALRKQNSAPDLFCGGRGTCGLCSVEVEKFGKVKSCQFRLAGTYQVKLPERHSFEAVSAWKNEQQETEKPQTKFPLVAIDIGTTTVAWICFYHGKELSGGFVNPQRQFGADVMSRIKLAGEGQLTQMQQAITEALKKNITPALEELLQTDGETDLGVEVAIAANTTMLHILNGWDCSGLGTAPFAPYALALQHRQLGRFSVTELPGISAFVGADIVSGLYAVGAAEKKQPVFFLDLGTNGEMAIGGKGRLLVTSAAAGPAFEASEQALTLHASGLLRVLHEMLDAGVMDENGTLCEDYFDAGYRTGDTVITQDLIRELQMAKAAIRAGIEILLSEYGIPAEEIGELYLAGGMGYYIDPEDAIAAGLIPESFRGKIKAVGNVALSGAAKFLREPETAAEEFSKIIGSSKELLLAEHPDFEELYIRYMSF